jgi:hypothetical protein
VAPCVAVALLACTPELRDDQFLCVETDSCPDGFQCCAGTCRRRCGPRDGGGVDDAGGVDGAAPDADLRDASMDAPGLDASGTDGALPDGRPGDAVVSTDAKASCPDPGGHLLFVTSRTYTGNLGDFTGSDSACVDAASDAGLANASLTFAIISVTGNPARGRVSSHSEAVSDRCGNSIVSTVPDLFAGGATALSVPVQRDEYGTLVGSLAVWTGTTGDGVPVVPNCNDFNDDGPSLQGITGSTAALDSMWLQASMRGCNMRAHLYCFRPDPP